MRPERIDPMLMSITTPGLPPFHGNYGAWETAMVLPALAGLRAGLPERPAQGGAHLTPDMLDANEIPVVLQAERDWPSEMQFLNCRWLEHMDEAFAEAVVTAILAQVPSLRQAYDFLDESERDRFLPVDADAARMRAQIRLRGVTILPVRSATPYLDVDLDCAWDEEHGLGLVFHGTDLIEAGGGEVASSTDAAGAHREAALAALRAQQTDG